MSDTFKRYVEVGRVVLISQGADKGKLAVIVEIIDHNRALIDGPSSGVARQAIAYRHVVLTPFVLKKLTLRAGTPIVKKIWDASAVAEKWAASSWAKSIAAREKRRAASDFDRFQVQLLKKQKRRLVGAAH